MGDAGVMYEQEEKYVQNFDGETKRKYLRRPRHIHEETIKFANSSR